MRASICSARGQWSLPPPGPAGLRTREPAVSRKYDATEAQSSASKRSSTPPWPGQAASRVLDLHVALQQALEEVPERPDDPDDQHPAAGACVRPGSPLGAHSPMSTTRSTVPMSPPRNPSHVFFGESFGVIGVAPNHLPVK